MYLDWGKLNPDIFLNILFVFVFFFLSELLAKGSSIHNNA
jgi:hypothetical protein